MRPRIPRLVLPLLAALVAAVACSKKAAVDADAPLAFVPVDTPYVFANLEPIPDAVIDANAKRMREAWPLLTQLFDNLATEFEKKANEYADKADAARHSSGAAHAKDTDQDADDPAQAADAPAKIAGADDAPTGVDSAQSRAAMARVSRIFRAVLDEFRTRDTPEKWRELGFDPKGYFAMYGIGPVPVMRLSLADPEALRATVARIEQKTGEKLPVATIAGQSVWSMGDEKLSIVMAVQGKHLVLTFVPMAGDEALKRRLLGIDRPAKSLADGALAEFNKQRGYLAYGSGWLDSRKLVAAIFDDPTTAAFATALGEKAPSLDPVCRSEFDGLAAKAPLFAAGYTRLDAHRMDSNGQIDLDPTLAQQLVALAPALPASDGAPAILDLALSLPVLKFRDFMIAQADAVEKSPFRCEKLVKLNTDLASAKAQYSQTIPPPLSDLTGVRFTLSGYEWPEGAAMPQTLRSRLVVGSTNPAFLLSLGQMSMSALQNLKINPDGKPVALPDGLVPTPELAKLAPHLAMGPKALGASVGVGEEQALSKGVLADPTNDGRWFQMAYSGEFYRLMARFGKLAEGRMTGSGQSAAPHLEAQMKLYELYANWFKRMDMHARFTSKGIEFRQDVEMNP